MLREQVYNFAPGPSTMPESALKTAAAEMLNFRGSGMSVMEISHRSPLFQEVFDSAKAKLRRLMRIPDTHEILLVQGGATTQFAAIPMNLMTGSVEDWTAFQGMDDEALWAGLTEQVPALSEYEAWKKDLIETAKQNAEAAANGETTQPQATEADEGAVISSEALVDYTYFIPGTVPPRE